MVAVSAKNKRPMVRNVKTHFIFDAQKKNDKKGRKGKENLEDLKKEVEMDEHKIAIEELIKRLKTDTTKGLSSDQAKAFLVGGRRSFFEFFFLRSFESSKI